MKPYKQEVTKPARRSLRDGLRAKIKARRRNRNLEEQRWTEIHAELAAYFAELKQRYRKTFRRSFTLDIPNTRRLDEIQDDTGVRWTALLPEATLAQAVELLMELRSLSERCGYEDMRHADDSIRLMESAIRNAEQYCHICLTEAQFDAAGERRDTWICWCRQNRIRLVAPKGEGRYCDRVEEETYEVYLRATYPGLADDAATYGVVGMRRISK